MMKLTKRETTIYELGHAQGLAKGFSMALEMSQPVEADKPKANGLPTHPSMEPDQKVEM